MFLVEGSADNLNVGDELELKLDDQAKSALFQHFQPHRAIRPSRLPPFLLADNIDRRSRFDQSSLRLLILLSQTSFQVADSMY